MVYDINDKRTVKAVIAKEVKSQIVNWNIIGKRTTSTVKCDKLLNFLH